MQPLKPTRRDPDNHFAYEALAHLGDANRARIFYDAALSLAISIYGDGDGRTISGVYRSHYPAPVKDQLRQLVRSIGVHVDAAYQLWRQSGRRARTLRPYAQAARRLPDGRVSYY